ncbi:membrane protein DedA with SNARE-associated domain [Rhodoglobus vestalii]|uniref:Membrane protein DedA with SNARE-associated domain n=1 Tax=Rhodoglobus vestalii TaxID=193384 RepID=A0A8H2K759_9MICO|nr:membrane protein DedA with SNARE-associated domain [Rhodoglobus vestalii]
MHPVDLALSAEPITGGAGFGQWLNDALTYILDTVQSVDPALRTVLAGVAIMLETSIFIGLIVPGDTVVIVASTAVGSVVEGSFLVAAVIVGALIGESVGFALGRYFGPKIRESRLGDRIGRAHWDQAERYLARRGGIAVFISRFLPVLHSLIPVTVGMSAMRYRTFMAWTVPATTIWSITYVSVGALAAGSFRELLDSLHYAGYIFVAIVAGFAVLAILAKKLLQRSQKRHMEILEHEHEQPR